MGIPRNIRWFWLAALAAGWGFDFLFWQKPPGISFLIWVFVALVAGYGLGWYEKSRPALANLVLTALAVILAAQFSLRAESFTRFLSAALALGALILLAETYTHAHWVRFRLVDYISSTFHLVIASLSRPIVSGRPGRAPADPAEEAGSVSTSADQPAGQPKTYPSNTWKNSAMPVLRGVLIALPVVAVLAALLAAADLVFAARLNDFLRYFDLNKLPEYIFRFCYILLFAYLLVGVYLHALLPMKREPRPDPHISWFPRFLGMTESGVVLGSVIALFIFFVALQFRYLFGGEANISETGFTYSDYARRGFFELVAVVMLTLLLYLALNAVTRRDTARQQWVFSGFSVVLIALVLVILASALQRLLLYENAYGFTRLRTYTHVFILWLALLLAAVIVLEIIRRPGHFALALLAVSYGFGLSMGILNIDAFIARQNIQRAVGGSPLDISYLASLSADSTPTLLAEFRNPAQPAAVRSLLGGALACQAEFRRVRIQRPWQSFHFGEDTAARLLTQYQAEWSQYPVSTSEIHALSVKIDGKEYPCYAASGFD